MAGRGNGAWKPAPSAAVEGNLWTQVEAEEGPVAKSGAEKIGRDALMPAFVERGWHGVSLVPDHRDVGPEPGVPPIIALHGH
jgi:hypothetical protein